MEGMHEALHLIQCQAPLQQVLGQLFRYNSECLSTLDQQKFAELLECDRVLKQFPVDEEYMINVLKCIQKRIESNSGSVMCEQLYEIVGFFMCRYQKDEKADRMSYRTYRFSKEQECLLISIMTSKDMLKGDTGCYVWQCSLLLTEYLLSNFQQLLQSLSCKQELQSTQKLQVVELGCGCGVVGIALAKFFSAGKFELVLTDGSVDVLINCRHNLKVNNVDSDVEVCQLQWNNEEQTSKLAPDIIIGADILYDSSQYHDLLTLFVTFNKKSRIQKKQSPIIILALSDRNPETTKKFVSMSREFNLQVWDVKYERDLQRYKAAWVDEQCLNMFKIFLVLQSDQSNEYFEGVRMS
eukprot:TRINITY_DN13386_c0_g1_i1.p1 TRINITY_DN13386_c0_g1~~TRINITY_DN13386_c0_g1_i1.p1  ORF type:complete len:353 (-),score=34.45 TRINITY_DN13386_c0_g1_i1:59-1117(-)